MGDPSAGHLANLYLFSYELEFMETLMQQARYKLAYRFLYVKRYIDDCGPFNNSAFRKYRYFDGNKTQGQGIYPRRYLTLNEEHRTSHTANGVRFLDLWIRACDRSKSFISNSIMAKQDNRQMMYSRTLSYPRPDTLLSVRSRHGIVYSEANRYQRGTMEWRAFCDLCADMLTRMIGQGYSEPAIMKRMTTYCFCNLPLYGDFIGRRTIVTIRRGVARRLYIIPL